MCLTKRERELHKRRNTAEIISNQNYLTGKSRCCVKKFQHETVESSDAVKDSIYMGALVFSGTKSSKLHHKGLMIYKLCFKLERRWAPARYMSAH